MKKRELVALFMESPFYFELTPKERLWLFKDHRRRYVWFGGAGPHDAAVTAKSPALVMAPFPGEPQRKG